MTVSTDQSEYDCTTGKRELLTACVSRAARLSVAYAFTVRVSA